MSATMENRSIGQRACFICGSAEVNDLELGEFKQDGDILVHYFCLLSSSYIQQNGDDNQGILGFLSKDIQAGVKRCKRNRCSYCKKSCANIWCSVPKCRRVFHTNCGLKSDCLMQFLDEYNSFCKHHAVDIVGPVSSKESCHEPNEMCCICHEDMGEFHALQSIQSPCCKRHWFHKRCVMHFASTAGYAFKCPMCNDQDVFRKAMKQRGVFVPDRDAAWELELNAFADLFERPNTCEISTCVCPNGRGYRGGDYSMLRCVMCGSHCAHEKCLPEGSGSTDYRCADCDLPSDAETLRMSALSQKKLMIHGKTIAPVHFGIDEVDRTQIECSPTYEPTVFVVPGATETRNLTDDEKKIQENEDVFSDEQIVPSQPSVVSLGSVRIDRALKRGHVSFTDDYHSPPQMKRTRR